MTNLTLSFATCDYDHVRDLTSGRIKAEGIDITPMITDEPHKIFHRMTHFTDYDISEMSFGRYISLVSQRKNEMIAIPVFPSRVARLSAFYVRADSKIKSPKDLKGKRVGVPEWAQTATLYARGWLAHHAGVKLTSVKWFQTGVDQGGRPEPVKLKLPKGLNLTRVADRSLTAMLLDGDLDCVITALPPKPVREGAKSIKRLIGNARRAEEAYFKETGIFPIMHLITIKKAVYEKHPWVAGNLFDAFERAKNNALERALKGSHSIYPVPWGYHDALHAQEMFGEDFWPYGLEPNRPTIEAFLRFGHEQGVCHRRVAPEELFAPQTLFRAVT